MMESREEWEDEAQVQDIHAEQIWEGRNKGQS